MYISLLNTKNVKLKHIVKKRCIPNIHKSYRNSITLALTEIIGDLNKKGLITMHEYTPHCNGYMNTAITHRWMIWRSNCEPMEWKRTRSKCYIDPLYEIVDVVQR